MKNRYKLKKCILELGWGENFGIKRSLIYITILSEHYMPKYIIYIKITLFKEHVQNGVGVA